MIRARDDKFRLRHELVRYTQTHGIRAAVRRFGCTSRPWVCSYTAGRTDDDSFASHSCRPHHAPERTAPALVARA